MIVGLFRNRLRPEAGAAYEPTAQRMVELVEGMPGFRGIKTFTAEDGERISVFAFDTLEQVRAWREHPEHLEAQRRGRNEFYAEYELQICEQLRGTSFRLDEQGD